MQVFWGFYSLQPKVIGRFCGAPESYATRPGRFEVSVVYSVIGKSESLEFVCKRRNKSFYLLLVSVLLRHKCCFWVRCSSKWSKSTISKIFRIISPYLSYSSAFEMSLCSVDRCSWITLQPTMLFCWFAERLCCIQKMQGVWMNI